ncbi:MAG: hypothetical protein V4633_09465 [Pseudomonadota bacterium]
MKLSFLRPTIILAAIIGIALTACGGKAQFDIGGDMVAPDPVTGADVVTPLPFGGLVLTNSKNGATVSIPANARNYKFPSAISYGEEYAVTVSTPPENMVCLPLNASDTAGRLATIKVNVRCGLLDFAVGGTVTGLPAPTYNTATPPVMTSKQLVIINGSDTTSGAVIALPTGTAAGAPFQWAFPVRVPYGSSYGLTIQTQPTGAFCTIVNGVGTVRQARGVEITNVNITCVATIG